ncbi:major capsid protein [Edwardsiella phage PVN09]|uniref:Major capsid protein n=1 Tax=Edwardsiella phage PVN09 TaxID=2859518 RepID=A0AAE8AUL2_9CAUD|nr:major capsid protein [Edwardsiella phage PVN09]
MGMLMFSSGHKEYCDSDLLPFAYKKTPSLIIKVEEYEYSDDCVMVNRYA